jgi:ABC-type hemin transport system substrate-binding protein
MCMATRIRARLHSLIWSGKCKPHGVHRRLLLLTLGLLPVWAWAQASAPESAQRIVSLAPHITELVFAAGAGNRLIGTVQSSDFPKDVEALPSVGDGLHIDPETLISLQPDLVLGWQAGATQGVAPILKTLGIPLVHINPKSVQDIPDAIEEIGRLTDNNVSAQAAAESIRERLTHLKQHAPTQSVSIVLEINPAPLYVVGNDPLLNNALQYCNATNQFADVPQAAPLIGLENLLANQPDFIVIRSESNRLMKERTGFLAAKGVQAARQGKVIGIDPDLLFRPGPRLVDALEQLCTQLQDQR